MNQIRSDWDDLTLPDYIAKNPNTAAVNLWLAQKFGSPVDHDFELSTDGSGDIKGWGGYAAVSRSRKFDMGEDFVDVRCGSSYGQTVSRSEFTALLEGLYGILTEAIRFLHVSGQYDSPASARQSLLGDGRLRVAWITDRKHLAWSLVKTQDDKSLQVMQIETDLKQRLWSLLRYVCLTPFLVHRNRNEDQTLCDTLCGSLRRSAVEAMKELEIENKCLIKIKKAEKVPQTAML